jgi:hypothetical protein
LENTSVSLITGIFNSRPEGGAFVDDGWNWTITYVGGTGSNDAILTAVSPIPEPGALALLGAASILSLRRRRRR